MNAVILAGGFGSRLKPFTDSVPKPMLTVANTPMLDYAVSHLYNAGISDMVFTLGYYPEQVEAWVQGYENIKSRCLVENVPLGTAGGVKEASKFLDGCFIVVSGDALENVDYEAMLRTHKRSGKQVTIAVTKADDPRAFGLVEYDSYGTVTAFTEKPEEIPEGGGVVNCGIYIMEKEAMELVPQGVKYDFARDLFPQLLSLGQIGVYEHNGFWSDLGTPRAYFEANFTVLGGAFYPPAKHSHRPASHKLGYGKNTLAAYSALITGKCSECIVGENAAVASDADIVNCVVLPGVTVGGFHYREIIGESGIVAVGYEQIDNHQYSTRIYKNIL